MATPSRTLRALSGIARSSLPTARAGPSSLRYASSSASSSSTPAQDEWSLPTINITQTHPWRYKEHYDNVLAEDLLYMAYDHHQASAPTTSSSSTSSPTSSPEEERIPTPYEANRPASKPRGNRPLRPTSKPLTPRSIPELESITIHTMVASAIGNKPALLNAIMALRAISGSTASSLGNWQTEGVQVLASKSGAAAFKLRAGMPVAVRVTLRGQEMYTFLQSLTEFVLPRLREFPGLTLPPASASQFSPSANSGVVAFGFGPEAMALFPQIETNLDSYPKMEGFHVQCLTSARGRGAQDLARTLMSGFRMPFLRK